MLALEREFYAFLGEDWDDLEREVRRIRREAGIQDADILTEAERNESRRLAPMMYDFKGVPVVTKPLYGRDCIVVKPETLKKYAYMLREDAGPYTALHDI